MSSSAVLQTIEIVMFQNQMTPYFLASFKIGGVVVTNLIAKTPIFIVFVIFGTILVASKTGRKASKSLRDRVVRAS